MSLTKVALALATAFSLATPALADPTLGVGLSFAFGSGKPQTGFGVRLFTDNQRNKIVGSLGVDYLVESKIWRGTIGPAYLTKGAYVGLDLGYGLGGGGIDFGVSGGAVNSREHKNSSGGGGGGCVGEGCNPA